LPVTAAEIRAVRYSWNLAICSRVLAMMVSSLRVFASMKTTILA
jgi:hypothetical protein